MQTTAMVTEILLVGVTFYLCLVPFLSFVLSMSPLGVLSILCSIPIYIAVVAAYLAGVMWNRVCDQVFHALDSRIIVKKFGSRKKYQTVRIQVLARSESVGAYLETKRTFIRILRAISVLLMVGIVYLPFCFFRNSGVALPFEKRIAILLLVFLMLPTAVYSWWRLQVGYLEILEAADEELQKRVDQNENARSCSQHDHQRRSVTKEPQ